MCMGDNAEANQRDCTEADQSNLTKGARCYVQDISEGSTQVYL